jgi:hypothetical protein
VLHLPLAGLTGQPNKSKVGLKQPSFLKREKKYSPVVKLIASTAESKDE